MSDICLTVCWNCRETILITDDINRTRCQNCGFNFCCEVVEVEFVSLDQLIEEEMKAFGSGAWL